MERSEQQHQFDDWLANHKGLLFKIVRAYAFNPLDREDLFQEICIQLWNSVPNFRGKSGVATWIYRVALYSAMAWTRREKKHRDGRKRWADVEHALTETATARDERLDWLYERISAFNEVDRSLTLLLLDGYSYREMAGILGITESNVGVKINRIRRRLTEASRSIRNGV